MTEQPTTRKIVLGMPGYGKQTAAAGRSLWRACSDMNGVSVEYSPGSLLACNFNKLWCTALNLVHSGQRVDYFAMLHDDIGCEDFWLDKLIAELEEKQLDVLGVVVPIKDTRGVTSIALHHEGDNWNPECRLTMRDVYQLPETFTSADVGGFPLLLNTGCWVVKWNQEWCRKVHFTINDRIIFDRGCNMYRPEVESEDWFFSRLMNEVGVKLGATRKISVKHEGDIEFINTKPWGSQVYDNESTCHPRLTSPVPNAWPQEIPGWLHESEANVLTELARGKRVLEIGSYCGLSTVVMGRVAEHVTAVDYFDGRGTPEPMDTRERFNNSVARYGLGDKVTACHPDDSYPHAEYDLVYIDGAHDEGSVQADVQRAVSVLAPGGLLAFHDYKHPSHVGVENVVNKLIADGGELLSVTETLAVLKPPALIPLEV